MANRRHSLKTSTQYQFPLRVLQLSNVVHDDTEDYPPAPLIAFQKLSLLLARLATWGLVLDVTLSGLSEDSVFMQLNSQVTQQTRANHVVWPSRPGSSSSINTVEGEYSDGPFIIMRQNKVSSNKMYHTLLPFNSPTYGITNSRLSKTLNKFQHPSTPNHIILAICV